MSIAEAYSPEFDQEDGHDIGSCLRASRATKGLWKPHPKSFSVGAPGRTGGDDSGLADADAAGHRAQLGTAPGIPFETRKRCLGEFDRHVREAREALTAARDADFTVLCPSRTRDQVLFTYSRGAVVRVAPEPPSFIIGGHSASISA